MHRPLGWMKRLGVCGALGLLAATGCSSSAPTYEPTTTIVAGHPVFLIYRMGCGAGASCPASIVINKQRYEYRFDTAPKMRYRAGPIYAVGPDNAEARQIPGVTSTTYRLLAFRLGDTWALAYSTGFPSTDAVQRQVCEVLQQIPPDSYCVVHHRFPPTSSG
jgi:hypothetical protein